MIFAPSYTRHERAVLGRLRLLGFDAESTVAPRHEFRSDLRDRLVAEAGRRASADQRGLVLAGH